MDGRTELVLTPLELLDKLAHLVTPPRLHKHRYCGVLAPNAKLRRAVTESACPAGATLQLLQDAQSRMGLTGSPGEADEMDNKPTSTLSRAAARCWALLLVRIYECLPLLCPRCGEPMRVIAFVQDPEVVEKILTHIGEPVSPPAILPARSPPQGEFGFDPVGGVDEWVEIDQTASPDSDTWA